MYFTDDSLLPENQAPLMITAAPYGPMAMRSLEGCTVTCRSHGMKVNVTGGERPGPGMNVRSFPLESRPDGIYVGV